MSLAFRYSKVSMCWNSSWYQFISLHKYPNPEVKSDVSLMLVRPISDGRLPASSPSNHTCLWCFIHNKLIRPPRIFRKVQFSAIYQPFASTGDKHLQKVVVWEIKLPREKGILEDFMWWLFLYTSAFLCIEMDGGNKHKKTQTSTFIWWSEDILGDEKEKKQWWGVYHK